MHDSYQSIQKFQEECKTREPKGFETKFTSDLGKRVDNERAARKGKQIVSVMRGNTSGNSAKINREAPEK